MADLTKALLPTDFVIEKNKSINKVHMKFLTTSPDPSSFIMKE